MGDGLGDGLLVGVGLGLGLGLGDLLGLLLGVGDELGLLLGLGELLGLGLLLGEGLLLGLGPGLLLVLGLGSGLLLELRLGLGLGDLPGLLPAAESLPVNMALVRESALAVNAGREPHGDLAPAGPESWAAATAVPNILHESTATALIVLRASTPPRRVTGTTVPLKASRSPWASWALACSPY